MAAAVPLDISPVIYHFFSNDSGLLYNLRNPQSINISPEWD